MSLLQKNIRKKIICIFFIFSLLTDASPVPIWGLSPPLLNKAVPSFHVVVAPSFLNIGKMEITLHIIMVVYNGSYNNSY